MVDETDGRCPREAAERASALAAVLTQRSGKNFFSPERGDGRVVGNRQLPARTTMRRPVRPPPSRRGAMRAAVGVPTSVELQIFDASAVCSAFDSCAAIDCPTGGPLSRRPSGPPCQYANKLPLPLTLRCLGNIYVGGESRYACKKPPGGGGFYIKCQVCLSWRPVCLRRRRRRARRGSLGKRSRGAAGAPDPSTWRRPRRAPF